MLGDRIGDWAGRWQAEVSAELDRLARQTRAGRSTPGDYVACLGAIESYLQGLGQLARHLAAMEDGATRSAERRGG